MAITSVQNDKHASGRFDKEGGKMFGGVITMVSCNLAKASYRR